ncbi:DUF6461 domain-containing protein [Streptomyces xanthochromogenes]|uniref:DUF6461 domain-containing protein n=1 Tax=Streptomyces xanthochromogenes TaxID=67384 RepID=UPI0037FC1C0B
MAPNPVDGDRELPGDQDNWTDRMLVGAALVHDEDAAWALALALKINGGAGFHTDAMQHATRGTRDVSHFRSPNAVSPFSWWEDGKLSTRFGGPPPAFRWTGSW